MCGLSLFEIFDIKLGGLFYRHIVGEKTQHGCITNGLSYLFFIVFTFSLPSSCVTQQM